MVRLMGAGAAPSLWTHVLATAPPSPGSLGQSLSGRSGGTHCPRGYGGGAGRCPAPGEVGAEPAWVLLMCSWRPQGALWGSGTPRLHWDADALVGPSGHSGIARPRQRQAAPGRAGTGTVPGAPWHCWTPAWHSLPPLPTRAQGRGRTGPYWERGQGQTGPYWHREWWGLCCHPTRGVLHPQDTHPTGSSTLIPPSGVPSCPRH